MRNQKRKKRALIVLLLACAAGGIYLWLRTPAPKKPEASTLPAATESAPPLPAQQLPEPLPTIAETKPEPVVAHPGGSGRKKRRLAADSGRNRQITATLPDTTPVAETPVFAAVVEPVDTGGHAVPALPTENGTESVTPEAELPETGTVGLSTKERRKQKKWGSIPIPNLKPKKRMERGIRKYKFIPKGLWTGGVTVSYAEIDSENFSILNILTNWNGNGHTLDISPRIAYFFWDNNCLGAQFIYQRTNLKIENLTLDLGEDLEFSIEGMEYLQQVYSASFFHRSYVGLGEKSRWGLFNETRLTLGGGNGYASDNKNNLYRKTYQDIFDLQLGIKPGLSVFVTENAAFEVALGVLGLKYRKIWQRDEQNRRGTHSTSGANFKVNVFNISLGLSVFL